MVKSIHSSLRSESKRTGWASLCCTVGGGVRLVHRIGPYNGSVKFESNDRYHCIRKTILNGDDMLV